MPILPFLCSCKLVTDAHSLYIDSMMCAALEGKQTVCHMLKVRILHRGKQDIKLKTDFVTEVAT
jgi:hypothetical protein